MITCRGYQRYRKKGTNLLLYNKEVIYLYITMVQFSLVLWVHGNPGFSSYLLIIIIFCFCIVTNVSMKRHSWNHGFSNYFRQCFFGIFWGNKARIEAFCHAKFHKFSTDILMNILQGSLTSWFTIIPFESQKGFHS